MKAKIIETPKSSGRIMYYSRNELEDIIHRSDPSTDSIINVLFNPEYTNLIENWDLDGTALYMPVLTRTTPSNKRAFYNTARLMYKEMIQRRHTNHELAVSSNDKVLVTPIIAAALNWYKEGKDLIEIRYNSSLGNVADKLGVDMDSIPQSLIELGELATLPSSSTLNNSKRNDAFEAAITFTR